LTLSEIRVLNEGKYQNQQEKKRRQRAQRNSESPHDEGVSQTRMDIERSRDKNDKALVEEMAAQN